VSGGGVVSCAWVRRRKSRELKGKLQQLRTSPRKSPTLPSWVDSRGCRLQRRVMVERQSCEPGPKPEAALLYATFTDGRVSELPLPSAGDDGTSAVSACFAAAAIEPRPSRPASLQQRYEPHRVGRGPREPTRGQARWCGLRAGSPRRTCLCV